MSSIWGSNPWTGFKVQCDHHYTNQECPSEVAKQLACFFHTWHRDAHTPPLPCTGCHGTYPLCRHHPPLPPLHPFITQTPRPSPLDPVHSAKIHHTQKPITDEFRYTATTRCADRKSRTQLSPSTPKEAAGEASIFFWSSACNLIPFCHGP